MRIFLDDEDYKKFLRTLTDVLDHWDVDCWDLCLMPNHYHLVVLNRLPDLSRAMQHLNGEYATWWNGRHGKVGHVFQGRYKDQVVQREGYLPNLLRYIAMNPVRAGLVTSPEQWPWSAYQWTAGLAPSPGLVCTDAVLQQFGHGAPQVLRDRYVRHVLASVTDDNERFQGFRSRMPILGDRRFKLTVRGELAASVDVETVVGASVAAGFP